MRRQARRWRAWATGWTKDGTILDEQGQAISRLGARKAVLVDLSPAATFIAYNYNTPVDVAAFEREAKRILREVEDECGWMYETMHHRWKIQRAGSTTRSGLMSSCAQNAAARWSFWDVAVDQRNQLRYVIRLSLPCTAADSSRSKRISWNGPGRQSYDHALGIRRSAVPRQVPVLINYSVGKTTLRKDARRLMIWL